MVKLSISNQSDNWFTLYIYIYITIVVSLLAKTWKFEVYLVNYCV